MIHELHKRLGELQQTVNRVRSVNVNSQSVKSLAIETGSFYFKSCRNLVEKLKPDGTLLAEYDNSWQDLIRLAQGNNSKQTYKKLLSVLVAQTKEISVLDATTPTDQGAIIYKPDRDETQLIETLAHSVPSAALSYKQALLDLAQSEPRSSYRGTAAELRETLREVLDHFAPDAEVEKEEWYKPEPKQSKPTMRQKVKFILKTRGKKDTVRKPAEKAAELIDELSGQLTRSVYDRASLSTHVSTQKEEVLSIKRYVDTLLFELLEVQTKRD
jgi:hypothetical protein